jgi:hypothetical protein
VTSSGVDRAARQSIQKGWKKAPICGPLNVLRTVGLESPRCNGRPPRQPSDDLGHRVVEPAGLSGGGTKSARVSVTAPPIGLINEKHWFEEPADKHYHAEDRVVPHGACVAPSIFSSLRLLYSAPGD